MNNLKENSLEMALELDGADWEDTTAAGAAGAAAKLAAAVFLSSSTMGKLEMDKLDDSA